MRIRSSYAAMVLLSAALGIVGAQAVTLPTIRASKTPEVTLLDQFIRAMQQPGNQPALVAEHPTDGTKYKCDLVALAITPYTRREVDRARAFAESAASLTGPQDSAKLRDLTTKAGLTPATAQRGTVSKRSLFAEFLTNVKPTRKHANLPPDGLAEILEQAPASCNLFIELGQDDVHAIIAPYVEAETSSVERGRLDSLERVARANVIQRQLRDRNWSPARSHDEATAFWKQPGASSLNIGAISGGGDQGATYTELTSRFLHAVRVSFSAVIASGKDSTPAARTGAGSGSAASAKSDSGANGTAISRFLNGGGLLNVAAAYPLVHYGQSNGAADFLGIIAPRFGGTLPVLGASQRDTTLMYDAGSEFMFKSADAVGGVGIYFQTRIGYAGGSPNFMRLIGDGGRHRTGYQTVTGGISLDDRFLVTMSRTVSGPHSLQQTGWQIGVSLARGGSMVGGVTP